MSSLPSVGLVVAVRGGVVDVRFDVQLPPIHSLLRTGRRKQIVIDVLAQRDAPSRAQDRIDPHAPLFGEDACPGP